MLLSRQTCVRLWCAATQITLPIARKVTESVQDMAIKMAEGEKHIRVTGIACYEALRLCNQRSGWDRDAIPSSIRGGSKEGMLLREESARRPTMPSMARTYPLTWVDFVRIVMD